MPAPVTAHQIAEPPAPSGAPARASLVSRAGVVACGCALAGAAAAVVAVDPSSPTSRFPGCAFHQLTGLWCPGCGLTRGTHSLLRGHPLAALGENLFTPFVLVAIVLAWVAWASRAFGRPIRNPLLAMPRWWGPVLLGSVLVFGVVRNVPFAPFQALAP